MKSNMNGTSATIQEECFCILSKTLNQEISKNVSKDMAIYGLEMQNKGFQFLKESANRVIEESNKKLINADEFNTQWHQQVITTYTVKIKVLNELINENNELIVELLKTTSAKIERDKELTKEDLKKYTDFLTVGKLKKFLERHPLPDDAKVVVQRVEDIYYEKHGWGSYFKKGEHTYNAERWNQDIENGTFLNKEEYPNIKEESLIPYSEEELKKTMEQYHPAWCCVYYGDDPDILFLDLHY